MAIGGINSYSRISSSYWNYQNALSSTRLQEALSKNPKYQKAVEAVNKVTSSDYSDSLKYLNSYDSAMAKVEESANALKEGNKAGVFGQQKVSSSDTGVADVSSRLPITSEREMTLDVTQLATEQKNKSNAISANDRATENIDFSVLGEFSPNQLRVQVDAIDEDGNFRTNRDMLEEVAKQINNSSPKGLRASVTEENGNVSLSLIGRDTGMAGAFRVDGALGSASGLDVVRQAAQNAEYSVTENGKKQDYASSSNNVTFGSGRINATLKSEGGTQITAAADPEKIASAVSNLVDNYNKAQSLLADNAGRGRGTASQSNAFSRNLAAPSSLERLGITKSKDGSLAFDKDVLTKSLKEEPALTKSLLSGSYGVAQTAFNRADSAMNTSSSSLINNDLAKAEEKEYTSSFQFMNAFSKAGANNLNNLYAMGMFVNYLA